MKMVTAVTSSLIVKIFYITLNLFLCLPVVCLKFHSQIKNEYYCSQCYIKDRLGIIKKKVKFSQVRAKEPAFIYRERESA